MKSDEELFADIKTNLYGIVVLLGLSSAMLIVHLYLAYFFHN
ncbi:MAG: hypothetical protein ACXAE3_04705 [Candidatus Kariarchaeaceae archaeon]